MPEFLIDVAMDARVYGFVEVTAKSADEAINKVDHAFVRDNFRVHGSGSDDYHYPYEGVSLTNIYSFDAGDGDEIDHELNRDLPDDRYRLEWISDDEATTIIKALKMLMLVEPSPPLKAVLDELTKQRNHIEAKQGN